MTPRRYSPYRHVQLGVSVRVAEADKPRKALLMTANRRGLLEAVAAGRVRYWPSSGWKCGGKAVNAVVRECVQAGWLKERLEGSAPIRRVVEVTDEGRKALGEGEPR